MNYPDSYIVFITAAMFGSVLVLLLVFFAGDAKMKPSEFYLLRQTRTKNHCLNCRD